MKKRETLANLRKKSTAELSREIRQLRREWVLVKADLSLGKLKNTNQIRQVRQQLAQVLTILKEKEVLAVRSEEATATREEKS